jgi:hypothetical protein
MPTVVLPKAAERKIREQARQDALNKEESKLITELTPYLKEFRKGSPAGPMLGRLLKAVALMKLYEKEEDMEEKKEWKTALLRTLIPLPTEASELPV